MHEEKQNVGVAIYIILERMKKCFQTSDHSRN